LRVLEVAALGTRAPGTTLDYAGESRQIQREGSALTATLGFAIILIGASQWSSSSPRASWRWRSERTHSPRAARWIARRIRGYVPQRQTSGSIAASICESLGAGFVASRAAAAMIIPAWQ